MERALDPTLLRIALGDHEVLPSVEEISEQIAQTELSLLLGTPKVSEALISTGWYLHAIASSKYALRTYGIDRQRAAFKISGHIFDLATNSQELSNTQKLKYYFASQIAYVRSELNPNAIAVYNQGASKTLTDIGLLSHFNEVSLSCGVAFLGFDVGYIYKNSKFLQEEIVSLVSAWDVSDIFATPYGAAAGVALATRDLISFLVYGRKNLLERARQLLQRSIVSESSFDDQISRWVAAHILNLSFDLENSSIWNVLPPDTPENIKRAFAMGKPRVLTLWPPQIDLLNSSDPKNPSPLSPEIKRLILSTPTSSGKTLLAELLITTHLAKEITSVYYIAPTRSLCREVKASLESRLRYLGKEINSDLPEGDWLDDTLNPEQHVEVMTPERLSYLIRSDSQRLLKDVGLFIFDEVHNLNDQSRGWTLEQDLSYLHYATNGQNHRIILISAAIGNQSHFIQWMEKDNNQVSHRSSHWRGPRRLHAIYSTDVDWDNFTESTIKSRNFSSRKTYPLLGRLDVRISQTGSDFHLKTTKPVGELTYKIAKNGTREKDETKSTRFYQMLIPIILLLGENGPVLVVESTRPATVRMAQAIADSQNSYDTTEILSIIDLVESRLGQYHPLLGILKKGVAYHHGSLPHEVKIAIEEAVSSGMIKYLVATTTMTEGVNLPVRSVVIASQGAYGSGGEYIEYITGSRLVNAIGRAGRATKETEGIVVLARQASTSVLDFERLSPNADELRVTSRLATEKALNDLAQFEEAHRGIEDAIFQETTGIVSEFLSFIWFIASKLENTNIENLTLSEVEKVLNHTLAWVQLTEEQKQNWLKLTNSTIESYKKTDHTTRQRWAIAGTSLSSSSKIDKIAHSLAESIRDLDIPVDPLHIIDLIFSDNRINELLALPHAPKSSIYNQRAGASRKKIDISVINILKEWMRGDELVSIAENNLNLVSNIDFRYEQLGDFIYQYFEIFLPWTTGTLITWTNQILANQGSKNFLPKSMPAYIRWGISNQAATKLMSRGLTSRTLAMKIANKWTDVNQRDVITWLSSLSISEWLEIFSASTTEIRLLLEFCRNRKEGAAVELITKGSTKINFNTNLANKEETNASITKIESNGFPVLGVYVDSMLVGNVFSKDQSDVQSILSSGLETSITVSLKSGKGTLTINLLNPEN